MNCESFQELVGMRCSSIGDAVEVITPFTFSDGGGIEVFAQKVGSQIHFFDDGFTLMHLHSVGIDLGHTKKRWTPLKNIAHLHGVTLSDKGVFHLLAPIEKASHGFAKLVSTLIGVAAWEREQMGISQEVASLIDEVSMYLRAWQPTEELIEKPNAIYGRSGKALRFDFQLGKTFIDAIQPISQSTGSELRKILDLSEEANVMVIVDDRKQHLKARQEIEIIGRVGTAWAMSSLVSFSEVTQNIQ